MSKKIYEEALDDLKKIKEVAEANAQRAVLEAVAPRISELIESQLMNSSEDEQIENEIGEPGAIEPDGDLLTDEETPELSSETSEDVIDDQTAQEFAAIEEPAISPPDEEGKVTLDLEALADEEQAATNIDDEDVYELNLESIDALRPLVAAKKINKKSMLESKVTTLGKSVSDFVGISTILRKTPTIKNKISKIIQEVANTYDYVQNSNIDSKQKRILESKLEEYHKQLGEFQETMMTKKKMINEEDVTLKLTGLPDDVDLDSIGIDLITGEEGDESVADESDEEFDVDTEETEEISDEGEGDELDLSDLEGDEEETEETEETDENVEEAEELDDDTVVEIDESMLRREIKRIRTLREASELDVADDESDEFVEESEEIEEIGDLRTRDEFEGSETSIPSVDKDNPTCEKDATMEVAYEARLQDATKKRIAELKQEARALQAKGKSTAKLFEAYKAAQLVLKESIARVNMIEKKTIKEGVNKNINSKPQADRGDVAQLRSKLAASNLLNAKLLYTNKLLQNESITSKVKAQAITRLDESKTVDEAKQVYTRYAQSTKKQVNESTTRKVIGSSSAPSRPTSTVTLNEGCETQRWAQLAGLNSK